MEVSRKKTSRNISFHKMGPNTPTSRNHGLGQIFPEGLFLWGARVHFWDWVPSEASLRTQVRGGGMGWGNSLRMLWRAAARDDPKAQA